MKNIFLFFLLSLGLSASAQYPLSQSGYLNTNGNQYGWSNGTDTIAKVYVDRFKIFKPLVLPGYTTGAEPTLRNYLGFHSDSTNNALFYVDGSGGIHNFGSIGGSGGGGGGVTSVSAGLGMNFSAITSTGSVIADTSYLMTQGTTQAPAGNKNFYGTVNLFGGGNGYIQGGNSFGATATFGTKDANQINFLSNNGIVASLFTGGQMLIGSTGVAPSQKFYVKGTLGIEGTITTGANSGFSVLSGFNFSSFAANNASNNIGFSWAMNNPYSSGTKVFTALTGDASLASGTSSVVQLKINPTYNASGSGAYTVTGILYDPVNTSLTNTTHFAFHNVSGDNKFNSTSGKTTFFGNTIFAVPTASIPSFNLPPSSAVNPSSPSDGDMWYNGTNLNFRHAGTTTDILVSAGSPGIQGPLHLVNDADYTVAAGVENVIYHNTLTANRIVTLPDASTNTNRHIRIYLKNAGAFQLNINSVSQIFTTSTSSSTSVAANTAGGTFDFQSDGTSWYTTGHL